MGVISGVNGGGMVLFWWLLAMGSSGNGRWWQTDMAAGGEGFEKVEMGLGLVLVLP